MTGIASWSEFDQLVAGLSVDEKRALLDYLIWLKGCREPEERSRHVSGQPLSLE